jgi:hypothetical protein
MHPRLFLAVLPALLCAALPALAVPIQSSDSLSVEARSLDFSSDAALLASRDVAEDYLVERDYDYEDLLSRDIDGDLFPRVVRPKTAKDHASEARKASVKASVAHNQAANAAKKTHLQGEAAKLPEGQRYGKPRKPKYTKVTTKAGTQHITGGYRKEGRDAGRRLPKQPKTPKPNFAKGEHLTNAKAVRTQAAAKARMQQRKADGRAKHGAAAAIHQKTLAHGNMPGRNDEYHVPSHGVLHGTEVRQGAAHLALHNGKGKKYPVNFRNDEQGPANNRHKPLPNMVGPGHEYPIQKGGYHPGDNNLGPTRGIYQTNPPAADGSHNGYNIQGVVSHDVTRDKTHPGYNDHIAIPRVPKP